MENFNREKCFLASIVKTSHDWILTIDLDYEINGWNKAAGALNGFSAREAIGKRLTELTLPKDFTSCRKRSKKSEQISRSTSLSPSASASTRPV